MATLKKYDLAGKSKGEVSIEDQLLDIQANPQMVKDYLIALRANQRQWSASTQSRGEVNHSTKKPHAQKGTGNARQGFLGSPQYRGGGRVHAPRPKFDQHVRINRKERRLAIRSLLSEKIKSETTHVLEYKELKEPKSKTLAQFLKQIAVSGKRVLFLAGSGDQDYSVFAKSLRNLPKVSFQLVKDINGYDLAISQQVVVLDSAVEQLKNALKGDKD